MVFVETNAERSLPAIYFLAILEASSINVNFSSTKSIISSSSCTLFLSVSTNNFTLLTGSSISSTHSTNSIRTISRYCSFSIPSACFAASSRLSEKPISLAELSSNWYSNSLLSIWLLRSIPVRKLRIGELVYLRNV